MTDSFREGNRVHHPDDECPGCHAKAVHYAADFKKFGSHQIRVCLGCRKVFHNGKPEADVSDYTPLKGTG